MMELDTRHLEGNGVQVFCDLAYGHQVDQELLKQVKRITDLGDAPYLKQRQQGRSSTSRSGEPPSLRWLD